MSKTYPVSIQKTFYVTIDDIDTIMSCALDGGITYWCDKAVVLGEYLGEYASDQISRGGYLNLHDGVEGKWHTIGITELLKGIKMAANREYFKEYNWIDGDGINTHQIDSAVSDVIIQLALFDDVIYE